MVIRRWLVVLVALQLLSVLVVARAAPVEARRDPSHDTKPDRSAKPPKSDRGPRGPGRGSPSDATTTTTTTTTTAPVTITTEVPDDETPPPSDRPGFVVRRGAELYLDGRPWRFIGVNAPQAATLHGVNHGCGAELDLDGMFAALPHNSAVRVTFGQDQAINATTGARDWRPLDRVVAAAERSPSQPKLIVSLTNQGGICDGGVWKDSAWYGGGYRQVHNDYDDGLPRVSYWDFIHEMVPRYADSPAIAMWEPAGEPEAADCAAGYTGTACYSRSTCPANAPAVLRGFFDTVGAEFKRMAPDHLIATAVIGGAQCGLVGEESVHVHSSPFVDVATFHDYGNDAVPLPDELRMRIEQARSIGKPIISEETGIWARDVPGCTSLSTRAEWMRAKMDAAFANGVSGFLAWAWTDDDSPYCDTYIGPSDPLRPILGSYEI